MHHDEWSRLVMGVLALSASSCRGRTELISPEPIVDSSSEQTLFVDSATLDLKRIARYRIVPEMENGRVLGIRLFIGVSDAGAEPDDGSGFRTLDRIEAVDGVPARTTDMVIEAFSRVRDEREVRFHVRRRGHLLRLVCRPATAAPGK